MSHEEIVSTVGRLGLEGLQLHPAGDLSEAELECARHSLMGVRLVEATLRANVRASAEAVEPSPEAERCRIAVADVVERAATLAAVTGNLERLTIEYQRSLRRARAIADVILPDLARERADLETRLEELEQEDAIFMAQAAQRRPAA